MTPPIAASAAAAAAAPVKAKSEAPFKAGVLGACRTADNKYPKWESRLFPTPKKCEERCAANPACKGYAYATSTKNCQLYGMATANKPGTNNADPLTKGNGEKVWKCYIKNM
jgi:hypothetical protein